MREHYPCDALLELLNAEAYLDGERLSPQSLKRLGRYYNCVSSDTRQNTSGALFVALIGQRFDAHHYLDRLSPDTAAVVLSRRFALASLPPGCLAFLVEDTEQAFLRLAAAYRQQLPAQVIAVSGSYAKTSTREMIRAACSSRRVHSTKANLNNQIGLSQSIFAADEDREYLVLELGIDHPGEMQALAEVAQADAAVLTAVGHSHFENFGSQEAILAEKWRLAASLAPTAPLFLNGEDAFLWAACAKEKRPAVLICRSEEKAKERWTQCQHWGLSAREGQSAAEMLCYWPSEIERQENKSRFWVRFLSAKGEGKLGPFVIEQPGWHQIQNALFGIAVATHYGLSTEEIREGLLTFRVEGDRQRLHTTEAGIHIINDAYNASYESSVAALDLLTQVAQTGRRVVAFGGIAELGSEAERIHEALGEAVAASQVDAFFVSGPWADAMARGYLKQASASTLYQYRERDALIEGLQWTLQAGDWLLLKASRSFAFEAIIPALEASCLAQSSSSS